MKLFQIALQFSPTDITFGNECILYIIFDIIYENSSVFQNVVL